MSSFQLVSSRGIKDGGEPEGAAISPARGAGVSQLQIQ